MVHTNLSRKSLVGCYPCTTPSSFLSPICAFGPNPRDHRSVLRSRLSGGKASGYPPPLKVQIPDPEVRLSLYPLGPSDPDPGIEAEFGLPGLLVAAVTLELDVPCGVDSLFPSTSSPCGALLDIGWCSYRMMWCGRLICGGTLTNSGALFASESWGRRTPLARIMPEANVYWTISTLSAIPCPNHSFFYTGLGPFSS